MRVGIIGLNHKLAALRLRETMAKVCHQQFGSKKSDHENHHFVLLSTCNRTELYFSSEDLTDTHGYILQILKQHIEEPFDQQLYSYFGYDCFWHLSRVTSGLDSAIIAETEIQGQVKGSYEQSAQQSTLPFGIHFLFQKCLKIGKMVRSEILTGCGMPNLEHAVLNIGLEIFSDLREKNILIVGASEINRKILSFFHQKKISNITLCNRTQERATPFIEQYNLSGLPWQERNRWKDFDWVICGTKAPEYVIEGESCGRQLLLDLSVPRNIDPEVGGDDQVTLMNIDEINQSLLIRRDQMNDLIIEAELTVTEASLKQTELFRRKERDREAIFAIA